MPDLRALLGDDRYDAMHAIASETYWSRGGTERDSFRMAVDAALAAVLPDLLAEARRDGAWDAIEHMGDELGWTHTPNCAGRVSFPTSPTVCICHADVLGDMRGRFNYPADHDRTDHA